MQKGKYCVVECRLWNQSPLGFSSTLPLRSSLTLDKTQPFQEASISSSVK